MRSHYSVRSFLPRLRVLVKLALVIAGTSAFAETNLVAPTNAQSFPFGPLVFVLALVLMFTPFERIPLSRHKPNDTHHE